jgi:hypothetical protein
LPFFWLLILQKFTWAFKNVAQMVKFRHLGYMFNCPTEFFGAIKLSDTSVGYGRNFTISTCVRKRRFSCLSHKC